MRWESIEFPHNAQTVYTAVKKAFIDCGEFRGIHYDDHAFRIEASHGWPLWGENVKIKVVASGINSSEVEVKSSDKLFLNILKWGNNVRNVGNIMDFVRNEVYRLLPVINDSGMDSSSAIRLVKPDIRFRSN